VIVSRIKKGTLTTQATEQPDPVVQIIDWINKYRGRIITVLTAVFVLLVLVWYFVVTQRNREALAARDLDNARAVATAGNLPLAAADLADLVNTYAGTIAAQEGAIELARIRLTEGQPAAAMVELRKLIDGNPDEQFLAPAHGLLGAALEQAGSHVDAAQEYLAAAEAAWYDFLKAQYLIDAGRAYTTAGDTAAAIAAYERVMRDLSETDQALEAQVRLAELRPTGPPPALD
jgi:predicted negative regulator of RcsB-dependent stress response